MELSVNAIVILVIAIVMLGLILGFVKSKFSDISKNVELEEAAPPRATSSDPLTVSRTMVVLSPGEKAVLRLSYYEAGSNGQSLTPSIECEPSTGTPTSSSIAKTSEVGGAVEYSLRLVAATTKDVYICTITMSNAKRDITVKVV